METRPHSATNTKFKPKTSCQTLSFWGIIDLQYCNYYHLLSALSSKFQPSMTTFYYKIVRKQNTPNLVSITSMDFMHDATKEWANKSWHVIAHQHM